MLHDRTDRLVDRLARRVLTDHQPGVDGYCQTCRPHEFYPCPGRRLADAALRAVHRRPASGRGRV